MKHPHLEAISIEKLQLWAHVGVLENERLLGQYFLLNFTVWVDIDQASIKDDVSLTVDYSLAIAKLQEFSFEFKCETIEYYSHKILDVLEELYGSLPMEISLTKCSPPVAGFMGSVSISRSRNKRTQVK